MVAPDNNVDDLLADLIEFLLADEPPVADQLEGETVNGMQSAVALDVQNVH